MRGAPKADEPGTVNGVSGQRLMSYIDRIERLDQERQGIVDDIKDVKAEAKAFGFDVKTINKIIALRKQTAEKRAEEEALLDIYKAALGMLFDTPLGESARRRLSQPAEPHEEDEPAGDTPDDAEEPEDPLAGISPEEARGMGAGAASHGIPVTKNPFPAGDKRRAAWDEAWCAALGSDGMEIPEAFRRRKPDKPDEAGEPAA